MAVRRPSRCFIVLVRTLRKGSSPPFLDQEVPEPLPRWDFHPQNHLGVPSWLHRECSKTIKEIWTRRKLFAIFGLNINRPFQGKHPWTFLQIFLIGLWDAHSYWRQVQYTTPPCSKIQRWWWRASWSGTQA